MRFWGLVKALMVVVVAWSMIGCGGRSYRRRPRTYKKKRRVPMKGVGGAVAKGSIRQGGWGSLAYRPSDGRWGIANGFSSRSTAARRALAKCGSGCKTLKTVTGECIAVARSHRSYGWARGTNRRSAETAARSRCYRHKNRRESCTNVAFLCTGKNRRYAKKRPPPTRRRRYTRRPKPRPKPIVRTSPRRGKCGQVADHQARILTRNAPSARGPLAQSLEEDCRREKWSNVKLACILAASTPRSLDRCHAPPRQDPPPQPPALVERPVPEGPTPLPPPPPRRADPAPPPPPVTPPPPRRPPPPRPPARPVPKCRGTKVWRNGKCRYPN